MCSPNPPTRAVYADALRCLCVFMVILIHTTAGAYSVFSPDWASRLAVNALPTFAVPCFFMLSGAFILQKDEGLSDFFRKKLGRVLVPFLVWSIAYVFFKKFALGQNINIFRGISDIYHEPQYDHLWFMYPLIGLYLITPIVRVIIAHASSEVFNYTLFFLVFLPIVLSALDLVWKWAPPSKFFWGFCEFTYFFLGYFLTRRWAHYLENKKLLFFIMIIVGYLSIFTLSYFQSHVKGVPSKTFFMLLYCLFLYILFQYFPFLSLYASPLKKFIFFYEMQYFLYQKYLWGFIIFI